MTPTMPLTPGFPNPIGWAIDQTTQLAGGAAGIGFEAFIGGLTRWMLDAVVWVAGAVIGFFLDATDPNVQADWFARGHGPYAMTAEIAAALMVGFLLVGIIQGVIAGDVAGMLRRVMVELPMAVFAMVTLVAFTQVLIALTDTLSRGFLDRFAGDVHRFTDAIGSVSTANGSTAFVILLVAFVSVVAGVVLIAELVVRSALVYLVVALAPLVFAAGMWPALRGAGRRLVELLVALIVSKLVVAVALAVAAAAAAAAGAGGTVSALAPPEAVGTHADGSISATVGVLLAATAAFGVAAFSPLLVARLLPLTEAAVVGTGVRGGPLRASQQALSVTSQARAAGRRRQSVAAGATPGVASTASAGAAAPAAVGTAAKAAASRGVAARNTVATTATARAPDARGTQSRSPKPRRRPPRTTEHGRG